MKTISESKLATFAVGQQKKSRFQKAREEAEEKKRQEEAEAAKVYDSFVASFQGDDNNSKVFVRSSTSAPSSSSSQPSHNTVNVPTNKIQMGLKGDSKPPLAIKNPSGASAKRGSDLSSFFGNDDDVSSFLVVQNH
jgi:U2-associated protein SR140